MIIINNNNDNNNISITKTIIIIVNTHLSSSSPSFFFIIVAVVIIMTTFTLVITIKISAVVITIFMYSQSSRNWPPREFIKLLAPRATRLDRGISFALCRFNLFLIIGLRDLIFFTYLITQLYRKLKKQSKTYLVGISQRRPPFPWIFPA